MPREHSPVSHEEAKAIVAGLLGRDVADLEGYIVIGISTDEGYEILSNGNSREGTAYLTVDAAAMMLRSIAYEQARAGNN